MKQGDRNIASPTGDEITRQKDGEKESPVTNEKEISETLGLGEYGAGKRRWRWIAGVIVLVVLAVIALYWFSNRGTGTIFYKTEQAQKGDLVVKVTATGNLEPVNTVDVGSELSGLIRKVNVDVNGRVKQGDVLAVLDTKLLEANVVSATASVSSAKAALDQAEANLANQQLITKRVEQLYAQNFNSKQDYDAAQATLKTDMAAVASARAQIEVAQAALNVAQTNLSKAEIRSPVNGIVLSKNIEPGQAVAASFQTPVLFKIAEDLTNMQLNVDIDEADVGQVKEGQSADFTVDAYPDQTFPARLTQLYFASQTVEGVVTYQGVLEVDNKDLLLRPGMTATAEITTHDIKNVLLVPNSALRFTPPGSEVSEQPAGKVVWTLKDGKPVSIPVKTGLTDGTNTEILSGEVTPGMPLLIDVMTGTQAKTARSTATRTATRAVRHPPVGR